ncbi:MAG: hypothetical protein WB791_00535 [Waddliaceae bacterium]
MIAFHLILLYTLIPLSFAIMGGIIGFLYRPKPKAFSSLQHFTAGVIIASVSVELLPKLLGDHAPWLIAEGFVVGVVLMLLLERFSQSLSKAEGKEGLPVGLIVGTSIDLLIDGILIGIAFFASQLGGLLIAVSLSFCAFVLNLTVSSTLGQKKSALAIQLLTLFFIPFMLPIGALLGWRVVAQFPPSVLIGIIAFSVAALLFVGIEELLAEAHETKDTLWVSASFFLGFLIILLFISLENVS